MGLNSEGKIIELQGLKLERKKHWNVAGNRRFSPIPNI
jgi:hypothetical protein